MSTKCRCCGSTEHKFEAIGNGDVYRTCECGQKWHEDGETVWSMCPCGGKLVVFRENGSRRTRCEKCGETSVATNGTPAGDDERTCVDNTGMEDGFDVGASYLCEEDRDSRWFPDLIWAYDRTGKARMVFRERFKAA